MLIESGIRGKSSHNHRVKKTKTLIGSNRSLEKTIGTAVVKDFTPNMPDLPAEKNIEEIVTSSTEAVATDPQTDDSFVLSTYDFLPERKVTKLTESDIPKTHKQLIINYKNAQTPKT